MPNGMYGGVRGEKKSPLLDFHRKLRSYENENAPRRIALRRRGTWRLERSAAGGESCGAGFFFKFPETFIEEEKRI